MFPLNESQQQVEEYIVVRALCMQGGNCFKCVCPVCNESPRGDMRSHETCMCRVHTTCAVHLAFRA